jgi:hypothetical protein
MFDLLNDLFARSDDDDINDDEVEVIDYKEEKEGGDGEESGAAAAAKIAGAEGPAAAAAMSSAATPAVVAENELGSSDRKGISIKHGVGHTCKSHDTTIGQQNIVVDRDANDNDSDYDEKAKADSDDDDDEWNGLFQEFKTGMLSLKTSVSAVSSVAADVLTGAIEEAHASMATSLSMSAGAGRPPFVLSAADEDDNDEYFEEEGDEVTMKKFGYENSEDGDYISGEDTIDDEDEEVTFLQAPTTISNPRRLSTHLKLESLDVVTMRQRLIRAEEQRNMLLQMVDGRNDEICKLRFELGQQKQPRFGSTSAGEILALKRELEWWRCLVSSNTDDSKRSDASMKALSKIINQMRDEASDQTRDDDRPNNLPCGNVQESIKASVEVIRELQFRIRTIKENIR